MRLVMTEMRLKRFQRGLSQTELAEKTNIPQWKISDLELEKRQPDETERKALREVLESDDGKTAT
jgi:ribosome-binding protein aMBF1 (putative translation factor)